MADETWKMGAVELATAYAAGEADPVQVVAALAARIERLNPGLNAFVALSPDLAAQAEESRDRLRSGRRRSPLEGVPVALKDNLVMAGLPSAWGSGVFASDVQTRDELPVRRLREAGAVLIGKTNTPEFAVEGYTANRTFGVTRNPWDTRLTPGGSSGGAVAAVAAGLAAVAVGTDGGGSIRRPCGHTGLFGLKPSIGAVARGGGLPQILMDFEVVGPIGRSVRDISLVHKILAGPDRSDPASRFTKAEPTPGGPLKILYVEIFGEEPCDGAIRRSVRAAAERLQALGHEVIEGALPLDLGALNAFWGRFAQIGLSRMVESIPAMGSHAALKYLKMAEEGARIPAVDLFAAFETVRRLRSEVSQLFGDWDVVMTPTAAAQPWPAEETHPEVIDGRPVGPRGHAIYTGWVNASGHPAIALPAAADDAGLPIGFQLVGDLHSENMLFQLAEDYETASGCWRWPTYAGA